MFFRAVAFAAFALLLASCSRSSDPLSPLSQACAAPLPVEAKNYSVTDKVPTDFDSTATPAPSTPTTINFTLMLPARCPGDRFPLVLQSHGYGGTRLTAVGPNGSVDPTKAHFPSINTLVQALPYHGYVVISYDERGHGTPAPGTAPHNARIIDPAAETQDAIALLDWAYDHADDSLPDNSFVQRESGTGIAKDIRVGTVGYSYGGGFEMPLALLDPRVDTIVPNGTWNNLLYSLLPGDGVKLSFDGLLCLLASPTPGVGGNVNNTPLVAMLCNLVGPNSPNAATLRTRADLAAAATGPTTTPRAARDEDELLNFFYTHGTHYFESQTRDGKTVNPLDKPGYTQATPNGIALPTSRRPIPALFLQGNRDTLFNLTDAYFNYSYFKAAGGDVRLLTTEGGHMNPLAQQKEGTANCGKIVGVNAILAWFDQKLKGIDSADYQAIPKVCISVADTPAANTAPANNTLVGVLLQDIPVGSLSGTGAVPASAATLTASVAAGSGSTPVFVQLPTDPANPTAGITQAGAVLAGIPRIQSLQITPGPGTAVTSIAYVGVGIQRGSTTILVDDEVTAFANLAPQTGTTACAAPLPATAHCNNRGMNNNAVLLPGVGERLLPGDKVGLLFYENQVQYEAVSSGGGSQAGPPNPYKITLTNVELPILIPGQYPGSSLSQ